MTARRRPISYVATWLGVALAAAAELLLPCHCLECGGRLARPTPLLLCARCRGRLTPLARGPRCTGCARPLPGATLPAPRCLRCAAAPPPWRTLTAAWAYAPPLEAVVRAYKFRGFEFLGEALAREGLAAAPVEAAGIDLVVPMPLAWTRRLTRGYNQAERLARPLADAVARPCVTGLARRGFAPPQSGRSPAERRTLSRRAFRPSAAVRGRRLLLVDDVLTTGATARAASSSLLAAGAASVDLWVVAWTPPERPCSSLEWGLSQQLWDRLDRG